MATRDNARPVIIKRKKVIDGGGHHGGAWKVAYADFVTAMMAFFMLMWLMNATTETQRKGLADYFNPTIPINRISGGGDGALSGDSLMTQERLAHQQGGSPLWAAMQSDAGADEGETERLADLAREIDQMLTARGGESMASELLARHIVTRITDEGLVVEFFDLQDEPLFLPDTATPTPVTRELVAMVNRVFALVQNRVAINGHIRAYPEMLKDNPVWDLSTARAQEIRRMMEAASFPRDRIARVTGHADRDLAVVNAMANRNNRIELILLRSRL